MDDCITISDDEDVCILEHVVNLEPIVVDLTDSDSSRTSSPQPTPPPSRESDTQPQNNRTFAPNYFQPQRQQPVIPPQTQFQPEPQPQYRHPPPQYQHHPQHQHSPPPPQPQPPYRPPPQPQYQPPPQPQYQPPPQPQYQPPPQYQYQQPPKPPSPPQPKPQSPRESQQQPSSPHVQPQPPQSGPQLQQELPPQSSPQAQSEQRPHSQQPDTQPKLSDRELLMAKKNLGNEKYKSNALNEAISIYRQASELAKRLDDRDMLATLHFNLAMTYDRLGSLNQAADECAKAVKLKDDYMKPHIKRADLYERMRKLEEAVICWEHICELDGSRTREYAIRLEAVRDAAKRIKKRDPFAVLGINPISFTKEDLKKAYKRKALTHHPDRHPDADIVTRRIQEKLFKDASEAHSSIQLKYRYSMR